MKKYLVNLFLAGTAFFSLGNAAFAAISLVDTIELLPGPDAYNPQALAINHATHRVYVMGAAASGLQDIAVKVLDSTSGALVGNIDLGRVDNGNGNGFSRFEPRGIAVDESTTVNGNRLYTIGLIGNSYYIRTIQNDAVVGGADVSLGANPDPYVGFSPITVNSNTHKVYFVSDNGGVTVVDGPSHTKLTTFQTATGFGPHLFVTNPDANKIFLFGRSGAVVIDGASDTATSITIPTQFSATTGAYNPTTGRVYVFGSDSNGVSGIYSFDSSGAGAGSVATSPTLTARGMTVDSATNTLYLGEPIVGAEPGGIFAYSAVDLSAKGSFDHGAAWLAFDSGRVFLLDYDYGETFADTRNAVGILNVANGNISKTVVGYRPYKIAINAQTNRAYVIDEQAAELIVLSGTDHGVVARVPVNPANFGSYYGKQITPRVVAVSEALNRIYLVRSELNTVDGTTSAYLDVIDGSNNQLLQSVPLNAGFSGKNGFLAVDDNRHRVYVTSSDADTNSPLVRVLNADTNTFTTSFSTFNSILGLAVNPVTGKIYVSGRPNGGQVQIFDGTTFASRGIVNAGALPGPMAVNTQTNKIYVANTGAGSVDNSVTVINGATDQTETTFSNTNANNGDAVSDVAVDPTTNKIYVADNSNGFDATGRITIFNGADNGFQQQIEVGRYPIGLAFNTTSKELMVPNNEDGTVSVIGSGLPPAPPVPLHGGLSETIFRINGSKSPTNNVADTALHFSAQQSGTPEGLVVRVQYNTTSDNNAIDWVDLNNGSKGYMTLDKTTQQFVLSSTNYPEANGLYFRALSTAAAYPDSKSNVVGPFNLTAGQNHLGATTLFVATNGAGQEMKFRANVAVDQATITLYVQATTTPDDDASWVGLNDGRAGQMHPYADPLRFYLDTTNYPAGDPVYFRAVAKAVGFVDSISNIIGVKNVVVGTPSTVEVLPPPPQPGSQSGLDPDHPIIAAIGTVQIGATTSSPDNKAITKIGLVYDGSTIDVRETGATSMTTQYMTNVPGDHVIKAFAVDERGIAGYANPVYIRIKPVSGNLFTLVASGDWSSPANWHDQNGNPGVPGANDSAVVGALNATIGQPVTVATVSLNGGTISGSGNALFTVSNFFSIYAGALKNINLAIDSNAIMSLVGKGTFPMSGNLTNNGKLKLAGGTIVPVPNGSRPGEVAIKGFFDNGIGLLLRNVGEFLTGRPLTKPKPEAEPPVHPPIPPPPGAVLQGLQNEGRLITNDGGSLITNDGGSLITNDGGSLITNDGATLITNDGGSVISNDGNSIIGNDGASLITNDGGSRPSEPSTAATTVTAGFVQTTGETDLSGLHVVSSVTIDGGILSGSGVIVGSLTNNGGFVTPGHSAGTISVTGNFTQGSGGTLIVENGGLDADQLQVGGTANLNGNLHVKMLDGHVADPLDTFSPLSYGAVSGAFASSGGNAQVTMNATGALVSVNPAITPPASGRPANISTRMKVLTDDKVLIGGFIVTGPNGSTKKVLIRGMGPTLSKLGVPGSLSDPLIELHYPNSSVVTNDDWQQAANHDQIPVGFQPDPKESALLVDLAPGAYTVIEKGAHGEIGIGLTEIYDFDGNSTVVLANISTRGFIDTGDNVMIGGFIVDGTEPAQILVRGTGPSLAQYISGVLADPMLELHDANGNVLLNDDWRETQEREIIATTIPPTDNKEPAILATLVPGSYTAIVRGKNNTTGIGLVEAYKIK